MVTSLDFARPGFRLRPFNTPGPAIDLDRPGMFRVASRIAPSMSLDFCRRAMFRVRAISRYPEPLPLFGERVASPSSPLSSPGMSATYSSTSASFSTSSLLRMVVPDFDLGGGLLRMPSPSPDFVRRAGLRRRLLPPSSSPFATPPSPDFVRTGGLLRKFDAVLWEDPVISPDFVRTGALRLKLPLLAVRVDLRDPREDRDPASMGSFASLLWSEPVLRGTTIGGPKSSESTEDKRQRFSSPMSIGTTMS